MGLRFSKLDNSIATFKVINLGYDPDAQAFIDATGISGTNASAINTLVVDLKGASIWTKMKALYPFVGGTATTHKFNLKDPRDLDAAFRLFFSGGGTHSSNGYQPGGVNGYADTKLNGITSLTGSNSHISFYSRTDIDNIGMDIGNTSNAFGPITRQGNVMYSDFLGNGSPNLASPDRVTIANTSSNANFIFSSTSTNIKIYKNSSVLGQKGSATTSAYPNTNIFLSYGFTSATNRYSNRELAFASIGDGLTDLESQLFYQITEKYQVALGRNINALQSFYYNPAYNNETNAFLFSTQITNATIQTATNTLVSDLKTAGVFTKMKALYPMVGGTATTHKFNLVNAQDTNAAYRLVFNGGGTHSSNGYQPGGVNGFANTFFQPSINSADINNFHNSYYSRTDVNLTQVESGCGSSDLQGTLLEIRTANLTYIRINSNGINSFSDTNSLGFYLQSRLLGNQQKGYKNALLQVTGLSNSNTAPTQNFFIGAYNNSGIAYYYSSKECAFASIGDGLTDAEALAFYTAVQNFQTTLGRQV